MKRIFAGIGWFLIIWFLIRVVCGGIVGSMAGAHAGGGGASFTAGEMAGIAFMHRYGLLVLIVSIALAVIGTVTGFLPGTKKKVPSSAGTGQGGVWPPPPNQPRF